MTREQATLETRRRRAAQAAAEACWLLAIRHRLRAGPASTRALAGCCGVSHGREFVRLRGVLDHAECIERAGTGIGHRILWQLK